MKLFNSSLHFYLNIEFLGATGIVNVRVCTVCRFAVDYFQTQNPIYIFNPQFPVFTSLCKKLARTEMYRCSLNDIILPATALKTVISKHFMCRYYNFIIVSNKNLIPITRQSEFIHFMEEKQMFSFSSCTSLESDVNKA